MKCVQCGSLTDKVIDSRSNKDGLSIRRRRVCTACSYRYTTYETIERTELRVIKKGGERETLNREKIHKGLVKACEKRPVDMSRIGAAVDEIIAELHQDNLNEIPAKNIGLKVMSKLRDIDPVAYVRYVSVYREFDNVDDFIQEIQTLERRTKRDANQRKLFRET